MKTLPLTLRPLLRFKCPLVPKERECTARCSKVLLPWDKGTLEAKQKGWDEGFGVSSCISLLSDYFPALSTTIFPGIDRACTSRSYIDSPYAGGTTNVPTLVARMR